MNHIDFYKHYFELNNSDFLPIEHEETAVSIVYQILNPNGSRFILKICPRTQDYYRELYFLNYLHETFPVPRIIRVSEPCQQAPGALLLEHLPGTVLKKPDMTQSLANAIGTLLARIHQNRTAGYGNLIKQDQLRSDAQIYFSQKFEEHFSECKDHLPKKLLADCRHYYLEHLSLLKTVDGPRIVHGDFRLGNILASNDVIQGILDWSSAHGGFTEEDFCIMEHENSLSDPVLKKAFFDGYSLVRACPDYSKILPLLRMDRALNIIGFTLKRNTWQDKHKSIYSYNRMFLERFF